MTSSKKVSLNHPKLNAWVQQCIELCQPESVELCEGGDAEYQRLCQLLVDEGVFQPLNPKLRPNSFLALSDPADVARDEKVTFICSKSQEDAGPTNVWLDPKEARQRIQESFKGCMQGRRMYVVPYCMGPWDCPTAQVGVEITDSAYVVVSMHILARVGKRALEKLGKEGRFVPGLHSVGVPLKAGEKGPVWPCQPTKKMIFHFPDEYEIASFGSGYGGNALLGKKCLALRIASVIGEKEGWMADHMLILGITNPEGRKRYFAAALPSACGKTNLAMLTSRLPGWKVECVGDDIAWMWIDEKGQLRAVNPEAGFFGVAPGTSEKSNHQAMATLKQGAIYTNVAKTKEGDVWWEGMTETRPEGLTPWAPGSERAAHPNARYTVRARQCPIIDPAWEDPKGVPISAILFGGRRMHTIPLIYEARSWTHGVLVGAALCSETTAAAEGVVGKLRHDPFAMLPFCGYHMGDYFQHWLDMGKKMRPQPRIFSVNWFRKDEAGKFLWPGFSENMRVLKWIFERLEGTKEADEMPLGLVPQEGDLGVDLPQELLHVTFDEALSEMNELKRYAEQFKPRFPKELQTELERQIERCALSSRK